MYKISNIYIFVILKYKKNFIIKIFHIDFNHLFKSNWRKIQQLHRGAFFSIMKSHIEVYEIQISIKYHFKTPEQCYLFENVFFNLRHNAGH